MADDPTIYALSSGKGASGVAVIRLSGEGCLAILKAMTKKDDIAPRKASLRNIYHPENNDLLDQSLILYFKAPHSYTGEDCLEFHIHGGVAIIQSVLDAFSCFSFTKLADAGEFTRRAFDNNKMDLTKVESIADLIHAETEWQRKIALRQYSGVFEEKIVDWRQKLIHLMAYEEAFLDFPDEDLPPEAKQDHTQDIEEIISDISSYLKNSHKGERIRSGFKIVLIGPPNSGKSTFLNILAKRDVAIVSDIAGTTRDSLEVHLNMAGIPVTIVDTAGLRSSADKIEKLGIEKSYQHADEADLKLVLFSALETENYEIKQELNDLSDENTIHLYNKSDLNPDFILPNHFKTKSFLISAKTGQNIQELLSFIEEKLSKEIKGSVEDILITRERHRMELEHCVEALQRSKTAIDSELLAEDLRLASRHLGKISGLIDVEDILDVIFHDFCIGK